MDTAAITNIKIAPAFDMEDFMDFARETRLATKTLENLIEHWEKWQSQLTAVRIQHSQNSWLAVWLPESIERTVDEAWKDSPGEGFLLNVLAQYLCMAAIQDVLPQTGNGGCAPSPQSNDILGAALQQLGLVAAGKDNTNLSRRYAVLTYYPFRGGCEICAMRDQCPKANGGGDFASVVLPGYERGMN